MVVFEHYVQLYPNSINLLAFHQEWLRYSISILLQKVSSVAVALVNKHAAAFLRFRSVCEEYLDKGLNG